MYIRKYVHAVIHSTLKHFNIDMYTKMHHSLPYHTCKSNQENRKTRHTTVKLDPHALYTSCHHYTSQTIKHSHMYVIPKVHNFYDKNAWYLFQGGEMLIIVKFKMLNVCTSPSWRVMHLHEPGSKKEQGTWWIQLQAQGHRRFGFSKHHLSYQPWSPAWMIQTNAKGCECDKANIRLFAVGSV